MWFKIDLNKTNLKLLMKLKERGIVEDYRVGDYEIIFKPKRDLIPLMIDTLTELITRETKVSLDEARSLAYRWLKEKVM